MSHEILNYCFSWILYRFTESLPNESNWWYNQIPNHCFQNQIESNSKFSISLQIVVTSYTLIEML